MTNESQKNSILKNKKEQKRNKTQMKIKVKINKTTEKNSQVLFENVRCAFVNIAEPNPGNDKMGIDPAYELTILIPKTEKKAFEDTKAMLLETIKQSAGLKNATMKKAAKAFSCKIHGKGAVIKDGDKTTNADGKVYDGLEGHYTIKVKTGVNEKGDGPKVNFPIKDRLNGNIPADKQADELYAGAWYTIAVTFKTYDFMGNQGVTAYIAGVQKLKNGERLGVSNPFEAREDVVEDMGAFNEDEEF